MVKRVVRVGAAGLVAGAALLAGTAMFGSADAASCRTWDGGGDGVNWEDPANWTGNALPGVGQRACAGAADDITLSSNRTVEETNLLGSLTLTGGATLTVTDTDGTEFVSVIHDLTIDGYSTLASGPVDLTGTSSVGDAYLLGETKRVPSGSTTTWTGTVYVGDGTPSIGAFVNDGTGAVAGGQVYLGGAGSTFTNNGIWTMDSPNWSMNDGYGDDDNNWLNTGTVNVDEDGYTQVSFDNTGTVNLNAGAEFGLYDSTDGGGGAATWDLDAGTLLDVSEPRSFPVGTDVTGDGTLQFSGYVTQWDATDTVTNVTFGGGTVGGDGTMTVSGSLDGSPYIGEYGTTDAISVVVAGSANTTGTMYLQADSTLRVDGAMTTPNMYLAEDSLLHIGSTGSFTMDEPWGGGIYTWDSDPDQRVLNEGLMTFSPLLGSGYSIYPAFDNDGTVTVAGGELLVSGPSTAGESDDGIWDVVTANERLTFTPSGTRTLSAAASVVGDGQLGIAGGTVEWGSGTPITNLFLAGGTVTGSPTVSGTLFATGGALGGSGTMTLAGTATSLIGNLTLSNTSTLLNQGDATLSTANLDVCDSATLRNEGVVSVLGATSLYDCGAIDGPSSLVNTSTGTISVDAPMTTAYLDLPVDNDGLIDVERGRLYVEEGSAGSEADSGTWRVRSGANLDLPATPDVHNFAGATFDGAGTKNVTGATLAGDLDVTAGVLRWVGGDLSQSGTTTIGSAATLLQTGTAQIGGGTLRNEGAYNWVSGDLQMFNAAELEIAGTGALAANSFGNVYDGGGWTGSVTNDGTVTRSVVGSTIFADQPFTNNGTVEVTNGSIEIVELTNYSSGSLTGGTYEVGNGQLRLQGPVTTLDAAVTLDPGGQLFDVSSWVDAVDGVLTTIDDDGSLVVNRPGLALLSVTNAGNLEVQGTNTVTLDDLTTSAGSTTRVRDAGSTLDVTTGPVASAGTVAGSGTISVGVDSSGAVAPGNSTGILAIDGDYNPTGASTTAIEISGTTPGTGYDQVAVGGTATLDGTLAITTPGFTPTVGDTYTVLTATSVTGTFSAVTGQDLPGNLYYDLSYTSTTVVLTVKVLPSFSIDDVTVTEGDAGTVNATFTLSLSAASGRTTSVDYATAPGTATSPADFAALPTTTATFTPGTTSQTITVVVNGDVLDEDDADSYVVDLTNASNSLIGDAQGVGTITDDDATPTISIDDQTVTEGTGGSTTATFTATLSAVSGRSVSTDVALTLGTASGADASTAVTSIVIPAGSSSATVAVSIGTDSTDEDDETYTVVLSNPTNVVIGDGSGAGTITDDDAPPAVSIDDVTVTEGTGGSTTATFTVTLSEESGKTVTVDATRTAGSADAADLTLGATTLTFVPGDTSESVAVTIVTDSIDEIDETYTVVLSNPTNVTIGDGSGAGTITDDDDPPSVSIDDQTVTEGTGGSTTATFTATLSQVSGKPITADVALTAGSASVPGDASTAVTSISIPAGSSTASIPVDIVTDATDEVDETYTVTLSNGSNVTIGDGSGVGTITDDDDPPSASVDDVTVTEGDAGTTTANYTVSLSAASGKTVSVDWATVAGSATAPADYTAGSGTVTFTPGDTSETVSVTVHGDTLDEADTDTYSVGLSNPSNASIGDASGAGGITDDDDEPDMSVADLTVTEGSGGTTNAVFTLSLDTASGRDLSVDWATDDGTAVSPFDYVGATGSTTFSAGETSRTVSVVVIGDFSQEGDETFALDLSNGVAVDIADGAATGTIDDDDAAPVVSISSPTLDEGTGGVRVATFDVTLTAPSGSTVTVDFSSATGSATAPSDFASVGGTLSFTPGTTTRSITVPLVTDDVLEADETFTVALSAPTNATLGTSVGTATIGNDDDTMYVDSTTDAVDAAPGDGYCASSASECTLRAAVQESNALAGTQSIELTGVTYGLSITGTGENASATGDLDVIDSVSIDGNGATIDGNDIDRVMEQRGGTLDLGDVTLTDGTAGPGENGGALAAVAATSTTLQSVVLSDSSADNGGALAVEGDLDGDDVTITGSTASLLGGGLYLGDGADVALDNSSISNNAVPAAGAIGGGVFATVNATLELTDSDITGNSAGSGADLAHAGGLAAITNATVTLDGVTVEGNTATDAVAGIGAAEATLTLTDTVIKDQVGGGLGGAYLAVDSTTTFDGVSVQDNQSLYSAGVGILGGTATITHSSVTGNDAVFSGGVLNSGTLTLDTSTISGNTGGAFANRVLDTDIGVATITSVTFGPGAGPAIDTTTGTTTTVTNTVVAPQTGSTDCVGPVPPISGGYNLTSDSSCGFSEATDVVGDAGLGALTDSGLTWYHAPGAAAIDTGGLCGATDQVGNSRPSNSVCDRGAIEFISPP